MRYLRNRAAISTGRLDLPDYDGCFGGEANLCGFTDLDAVVERNDFILIVEMKKPGEELTTGQKILLESFSSKDNITVLVRWGIRGRTDRIMVFGCHDVPIKSSEGTFKRFLSSWWAASDDKRVFLPDAFFKNVSKRSLKSVRKAPIFCLPPLPSL